MKDDKLGESFRITTAFAGLFWVFKGLEVFFSLRMNRVLGLVPRSFQGLFGIFGSPFAHSDLSHLISNTFPFLVLGTALLFFYPKSARKVFLIIYIGTGAGVWLFGRSYIHIGASGLVYGMAFFLFFSGVFRKNMASTVIAASVMLLYGGMVQGLVPNDLRISWESHLIGALTGVFCAFYFRKHEESEVGEEKKGLFEGTYETEGWRNLEGKHYKYVYKPTEKDKPA